MYCANIDEPENMFGFGQNREVHIAFNSNNKTVSQKLLYLYFDLFVSHDAIKCLIDRGSAI